ncbi:MAG: DNA-formamidopyrimidine glycosylase family protein [Actinomycetota bacterium]
MPEGDTIFRMTVTLRQVLEGHPITRFHAPALAGKHPAAGTMIRGVEARGKHLLIHFADDVALHTHMQMDGSWHIYRHGERWWKGAAHARVVLETADMVTVCFDAPVVELLSARDVARHPQLASLGPDLCAPGPDVDEALRRMAELDPSTQIGAAMLDQRVAAGVGNVYKSEVLFACGVDPFVRVGAVDAQTQRRLIQTASVLLRRNLGGGPRTTVSGGLAVYDRAGRPCRSCGATIQHQRQGIQGRSTWWCPRCQPPFDLAERWVGREHQNPGRDR